VTNFAARTRRRFTTGLAAALVAIAGVREFAGAEPANQVPVGPRAIGMGGAFTSLADDPSALFWNPAGLVRIGHQEFSVSHANLFGSDIRDNLASFVLPLSENEALALDWYHSGFDDNELTFGENRVTLGAALKVRSWLLAGVGGKLVTRSTGLDQQDISSGRGFGLDLGLLATPKEHWRIGLVGQDITGTTLKSPDGSDEKAYPANVRLGTSYSFRDWGTAAFDVDDRWHFGVEATPHPMIALRGGVEQERQHSEGPIYSMGLGVKAGAFRLDWARSMPPTLSATDHFALAVEFSFNPSQVRIEKVQAQEVYTSLYKSYARDGIGSVQLRNLQDRPLTARVGVFIPQMMSVASEQDVTLRPRAVNEIPLTAVLDEKVLAQRGDQPIQVQVTASYQSKRVARKEKGVGSTVAYAPGAIDWSRGMAQAAAFVTPRDPAVDELARQASRLVLGLQNNPFGNRNIAFAAAMTNALTTLGMAYVPDPTNPFATISSTPHAVDTIHYPYQVLDRLSGDCDDTTVLMASLLGNVGVNTQFVDVPGHIFLLVDTGLHENNRSALGVDSTMTVVSDDEVWIPLETTSVLKGFMQAWQDGADEIATARAQGEPGYVDVTDSQTRYEPVLPPGDRRIRTADEAKLTAGLQQEAKKVSSMRDAYFAARFGSSTKDLETSADALLDVARIEFEGGDLEGARKSLIEALGKAPQSGQVHNNLGVVLAAMDSLPAAESHWSTAVALGRPEPGITLNRGLARWAAGDAAGCKRLVSEAVTKAGGYAATCQLIGLAPADSLDKASSMEPEDLTLRAGIRSLLRLSAVPGASKSRTGVPPPKAEKFPTSPPVGRMGRYLYWIE